MRVADVHGFRFPTSRPRRDRRFVECIDAAAEFDRSARGLEPGLVQQFRAAPRRSRDPAVPAAVSGDRTSAAYLETISALASTVDVNASGAACASTRNRS